MGTPSFVPADLTVHRDAIIGINIEYFSWVVAEIERSFGVPVQQLLGVSVPEYVSSTIHKVCADTPPRGVFYLIQVNGDTAGMCGLRFLHDGVAEIKRMYVRPPYRGRDLGAAAVHRLLVDASSFGYRSVYLDSAPFMQSAQRVYEALGFVDRAPYEGVEVPASMHAAWRFMQRDLSPVAPARPSSQPKMNPNLRPATAADALRVANLLIDTRSAFMAYAPLAHAPEEVRSWVAGHLIPSGGVTIAEIDGRVVATAATEVTAGVSWITQMAVDPALVGNGIGGALLAHVIRTLRPPIRLCTFQANHGARRFYERHGFVAIGFTDGRANEERCPDVHYEHRAAPKPATPILESVLTCPVCGFAATETMPTNACLYFYECTSCHALLRPKTGDCCVFCSFGSVRCPPVQEQRACCVDSRIR